jgi:hypothetical protein
MGWAILSGTAWLLAILFVPLKKWKLLWKAGLLSIVSIYVIDSSLIKLGAFYYNIKMSSFYGISGVPILYLLSGFPGALLLTAYFPKDNKWHFPYVLFTAALFLALELIMVQYGYFIYRKWSPILSYCLNLFGFTIILWAAKWMGLTCCRQAE